MSVSIVPVPQRTQPSAINCSSQPLSITSKVREVNVANVVKKKWSKTVRLLPILFFFAYLNFTVLLFAFGPWPYPIHNGAKLYLFLVCAHLALLVGYVCVAFRKARGYYSRWSIKNLVTISAFVNLLFFVPTSLFRTGSIFPPVWNALQNLGEFYHASRSLRQMNTPIIEYLRAFFGPVLFLLLPLTVFYWRKLSPRLRMISVFTILGNVMIGLAMGANREIFFPLFLSVLTFFASYLSGLRKFKQFSKKAWIAIFPAIFFIAFFANSMMSRGSGLLSYYFSPLAIYANKNHVMLKNSPEVVKFGMLGISSYLTQGYYALSLSLEKPFIPMFGVGHSMFLIRQAVRITGIQKLAYISYPDRIMREDGWNSYANYTTIYPWIASDISFPGVVVVMFIVGRVLGQSWLDTLQGSNPFAVAVFCQFSILLITVPSVNWVVNGGEGLVSFWIILLIWIFTRKKYVLRSRRSYA